MMIAIMHGVCLDASCLGTDVVSQESGQESNKSGHIEEANVRNGSSCHSL